MNGVSPILMQITLLIGFHPDNVCCDGCRCLVDDQFTRGRKVCFITHEIIHYPKQRGMRCPLKEADDDRR